MIKVEGIFKKKSKGPVIGTPQYARSKMHEFLTELENLSMVSKHLTQDEEILNGFGDEYIKDTLKYLDETIVNITKVKNNFVKAQKISK